MNDEGAREVGDDQPASWASRTGARLAKVGPSTQAAIPGFFAWIVSVEPCAWDLNAPAIAKITALLGAASLVAASVLERRAPRLARIVSVWGLVIPSSLTWMIASDALDPSRMDAARAIAAALGWGLFALASAAPAIRHDPAAGSRLIAGPPLRARGKLPAGDAAYLVAGAIAAFALQAIGWQVMSPERAVLVRLVAVASGLVAISAATSLSIARHAVRTPARRKLRLRRALPWIAFFALVIVGGVLLMSAR